MTITVQSVGECMIEFARTAEGVNLAYAGDTYNTAVYLSRVARELGADVDVRFLTGVGADSESGLMRAAWLSNAVGDDAREVRGATPGAYLIATDAEGERTFTYWRAGSAAAQLFAGTSWLDDLGADCLYLSGVSLQLMSPDTRRAFLVRVRQLRADGARVAFDSNYRPSGWRNRETARTAMRELMEHCDVVLVTLDDEVALGNGHDVFSCMGNLATLGVDEVVVKIGREGAVVNVGGHAQHVPTEARDAVDTTGAGDSFNGAFLGARLAGMDAVGSARLANVVAGEVVSRPGAIIPLPDMPSLANLQ